MHLQWRLRISKLKRVADDATAMKALKAKATRFTGDVPAMWATKVKAEKGCS